MNIKELLFLVFIFATTIYVFEPHILFLFVLVIAMYSIYLGGRNLIIVIIIVSNIALTGQKVLEFRPLVNIISLAVLLYYFVKDYGLNIKDYPKLPKVILRLVGFLLVTILIASLFSIDKQISFLSLLRLFIFFIFCYLIYAQIKDSNSVKYLYYALFVAVTIIGLSMFYEFIEKGSSFFVKEDALLRLAGIYENPNYVGLLLAITIPITFSYLMINQSRNKNHIILLFVSLLFQFVLLLLSDSRASFLSVAVSSITVFILSPVKSKKKFGIFIFFVSIIIFLSTDVTFLSELFLRTERIGTREHFWQTGLDVIKSSYLFGTGAGTFELVFYANAPSSIINLLRSSISGAGIPHPHNLFLYFWAENGILGLFSIILIFYTFFYMIIKLLKSPLREDRFKYSNLVAILSILIGLFSRTFFEITGIVTYGFITRDLPFWILIIVLTYLYQQNSNNNKAFFK